FERSVEEAAKARSAGLRVVACDGGMDRARALAASDRARFVARAAEGGFEVDDLDRGDAFTVTGLDALLKERT
ncbi:MAG: hypothetical protein ACR2N6_06095, partial [Miltoncostaeaceae bacterium]